MSFPDHPFWDFSLGTYGATGASEACLSLQERHGIDVNLLLFCLWLGAAGYRARTRDEMTSVIDTVEDWHEAVVKGLRAVRKRMKERFEGFDHDLARQVRARVQKVEIDTEHLEQLALARLIDDEVPANGDGAERARAGAENVRLYMHLHGVTLSQRDRDDLKPLIQAAFSDDTEAALSALEV